MEDTSIFSTSYTDARGRFLDVCARHQGMVHSLAHPDECGPDGERLHLDVAIFGPQKAERVLVVGSGTHGIEGYSGSAAQTAWILGGGPQRLPKDIAVVFTHGHNPWGFAHRTRVTEENVDLNRNFVDHDAGLYPDNAGYAELHPTLTPDLWDELSIARIFEELEAFRSKNGEQAFSDAYNGGQYSHSDGVFFGGKRQQWANAAFREAINSHVAHATQAAIIDFHTGIGPFLDHIYLCFHKPDSGSYNRVRDWWGERAINRQGVTHKAVADYQGLLVNAFCDMLPKTETTAVVVEFGTRSRTDMQRANLSARWLRYCGNRDPERARMVHSDYIEAFYPSDIRWRRSVLEQSREIIDRAVAGLARS